jgi:hypothetical protein
MMTPEPFEGENAPASSIPDRVSDFLSLVSTTAIDEPGMIQMAKNARRHSYADRVACLPVDEEDDEAAEYERWLASRRELAAKLRADAEVCHKLAQELRSINLAKSVPSITVIEPDSARLVRLERLVKVLARTVKTAAKFRAQ